MEEAVLLSGAVTVNTFCRATTLGRTKFYELAKAGKIRLRKVGRRTLIPVTEIQVFMDCLAGKDGSRD